ncbi:MAG TPA: serine/threonine-protein kinase [Vicinamibacterales bacterium]|nr:serine/threonine-protein kinase [Vicinamibacterales bacterium]
MIPRPRAYSVSPASRLPLESMIGTTVGKYRIVALLGRGATGVVYKALDDTLDREVAIKVLNPLYAAGDLTKRFHSEATTLARLSHPEIATIHELLRTDANLLMVMELVRGETLEAVADRSGPMSPELAGHIIDGILSALVHAHHAGVVHRDLKPANVMVTALGGVKIMDFGIARVRGAEHMTLDGCAVGTPAYMAPEQVLGEEVDGRADLYAVGLILYRLIAGRLPFDGDGADTPMVLLQKQVSEPPPRLQTYRPDLPDWCDVVVQRALAKAPADRFQTAEEFRAAVGRAIGLRPALDLAKALALSATEVSTEVTERPPVETIAISRSQAGLPPGTGLLHRRAQEKARLQLRVVRAQLAVMLSGARDVVTTRRGAAILAGLCSLGTLGYLTGGTSTMNPGTTGASGTRAAVRAPSKVDTRDPERTSAVPTRSQTRPGSTPPARTEPRSTSSTTDPLVFRAKLVFTEGRDRREEDARLTFARERLSVTRNRIPDEPVLSVPYGHLTAIEHSRKPGWKPPQKWSRVVKIEDDVLEAIGIRERHEISLHTDSDFVLLRVDEQIVNRVLRTLKDRTGLTAQLPSER